MATPKKRRDPDRAARDTGPATRDNDWEDDWDVPEDVPEDAAVDEVKILCFRLGTEEYGARLENMREVFKFHDVTHVPRSPHYLLGILSLRGRVIPVIEPRRRLGIDGPVLVDEPRVLVFHGSAEPVGARVDSVSGVVRIAPDAILPPLGTLSEEQARYIDGVFRVGQRFVSIVNLEEMLRIELPAS